MMKKTRLLSLTVLLLLTALLLPLSVQAQSDTPLDAPLLTITRQPENYAGREGETARLFVSATGDDLTYQWQLSDDGGQNWRNSSVKTAAYAVTLTPKHDGRQLRCIVTDRYGATQITRSATLRVGNLIITRQPENCRVIAETELYELGVEAVGDSLRYQWQLSDDKGTTWRNSSVKSSAYTAYVDKSSGRYARCVITDRYGHQAISQPACMLRSKLAVTRQPVSYSGQVGDTATFHLEAVGDGALHYKWQYKPDPASKADWQPLLDADDSDTCTVTLTSENNGLVLRCVISDELPDYPTVSVCSDWVRLSASSIVITRQPQDAKGRGGSSLHFSVEAQGEGLQYQWEYGDKPEPDGYWHAADYRTKDAYYYLPVTITNPASACRYLRCVITDRYGAQVISDVACAKATFYLTNRLTPVYRPEGTTVRFEIGVVGRGLTYQWQLSDDKGTTWRNSSVKTSTYITTLTQKNNGRYVRCVVTNDYGDSLTTSPASMNIQDILFTAQPVNYTGPSGSMATFQVKAALRPSLFGNWVNYQWQLSDDQGAHWRNSSIKAAKYAVTLSEKNDGRWVRCVITDAYGNSATSDPASMKIV